MSAKQGRPLSPSVAAAKPDALDGPEDGAKAGPEPLLVLLAHSPPTRVDTYFPGIARSLVIPAIFRLADWATDAPPLASLDEQGALAASRFASACPGMDLSTRACRMVDGRGLVLLLATPAPATDKPTSKASEAMAREEASRLASLAGAPLVGLLTTFQTDPGERLNPATFLYLWNVAIDCRKGASLNDPLRFDADTLAAIHALDEARALREALGVAPARPGARIRV